MTRCHKVDHARKDYPESGIKKGDTYYWWKFRFGGMHKSLTPPKQSQLTQSAFLGTLLEIQETLNGLSAEDDLESERDAIVSSIQDLESETQSSFDNMPENFQQGDTGQMLEERVSALQEWASNLEGVDLDEPDGEALFEDLPDAEKADLTEDEIKDKKEELVDEKKQEQLEEMQGCEYSGD